MKKPSEDQRAQKKAKKDEKSSVLGKEDAGDMVEPESFQGQIGGTHTVIYDGTSRFWPHQSINFGGATQSQPLSSQGYNIERFYFDLLALEAKIDLTIINPLCTYVSKIMTFLQEMPMELDLLSRSERLCMRFLLGEEDRAFVFGMYNAAEHIASDQQRQDLLSGMINKRYLGVTKKQELIF